jgi:hypothetical protein
VIPPPRLLAAALLLAACSGEPQMAIRESTILEDVLIDAPREATPSVTARELAQHIEEKYALVQVWRASAADQGDVVAYAVRFRLDPRSEHPRFEDWNAHVRRAARDRREAEVELLKLTIRFIPQARLVSVYQDDFLQPHWTRQQIVAMDEPASYRSFEAWQDLVLSAEVLLGTAGR